MREKLNDPRGGFPSCVSGCRIYIFLGLWNSRIRQSRVRDSGIFFALPSIRLGSSTRWKRHRGGRIHLGSIRLSYAFLASTYFLIDTGTPYRPRRLSAPRQEPLTSSVSIIGVARSRPLWLCLPPPLVPRIYYLCLVRDTLATSLHR